MYRYGVHFGDPIPAISIPRGDLSLGGTRLRGICQVACGPAVINLDSCHVWQQGRFRRRASELRDRMSSTLAPMATIQQGASNVKIPAAGVHRLSGGAVVAQCCVVSRFGINFANHGESAGQPGAVRILGTVTSTCFRALTGETMRAAQELAQTRFTLSRYIAVISPLPVVPSLRPDPTRPFHWPRWWPSAATWTSCAPVPGTRQSHEVRLWPAMS